MPRWVLHLDMDAFFASVEQLTRPSLQHKPLLVGGLGPRGVIAGASYEARAYGAHSAMPTYQARRLIGPKAIVVPPRTRLYRHVSHRVFDLIAQSVHLIEQISFDEGFAEPPHLAGSSPAQVKQFCCDLRHHIYDQTGLIASIGAGSGKQAAKIASGLAKPNGIYIFDPDHESEILASLPVGKLWGIGPITQAKLQQHNITTIGQFATMPAKQLAEILSPHVGASLQQLARGIDPRPVIARRHAKQISTESTFSTDLTTLAQLHKAIIPLVEQAHRRLMNDGRGARTLTVKIRKTDMSITTRSTSLSSPSTHKNLFISLAQKLLLDPAIIGPVRLLGVGFSGLTPMSQQLLFSSFEDLSLTTSPIATPTIPHETTSLPGWTSGDDVYHDSFGHGWVQGARCGVMTIRFETRLSGPGKARTFTDTDSHIHPADPLNSLEWTDLPNSDTPDE